MAASLNPYVPPSTLDSSRAPDWYLNSACRYYQWIGWLGVVYIALVLLSVLASALDWKTPLTSATGHVVPLAIPLSYLFLFALMIRLSRQLPANFDKLYVRARWLGILVGALGFPTFTLPAFLAVARLAKFRQLQSGN